LPTYKYLHFVHMRGLPIPCLAGNTIYGDVLRTSVVHTVVTP